MNAEVDLEVVGKVAERLATAQRILVITGAGVSAESGLPTYRGVGGLYDGMATEDGLEIEVALSGPMFRRDPALVWKYIRQIEEACRGRTFNRAHATLAGLDQDFEVWVLTQNVDGFHRAAGSKNIIDIHGNIYDLACLGCGRSRRVDSYEGLAAVPHCTSCGAIERPQVVLFEEMLPPGKLQQLQTQMSLGFDAVLSIGTSSVFQYIAQPVLVARQWGALSVEINPARTPVSGIVDFKIAGGAGATLQAIVASLRS